MRHHSFMAMVWFRHVDGTRTFRSTRERRLIRLQGSGQYTYLSGRLYPVTLNNVTGDYHCLIQY